MRSALTNGGAERCSVIGTRESPFRHCRVTGARSHTHRFQLILRDDRRRDPPGGGTEVCLRLTFFLNGITIPTY